MRVKRCTNLRLVEKNTSRGPGFKFQLTHCSPELAVTPVPGYSMPLTYSTGTRHVYGTLKYMQAKYLK